MKNKIIIGISLFSLSAFFIYQFNHEGKRAPSSISKEHPWTTWSRRGLIMGLRELIHIKEALFSNLYDTYTKLPSDVVCPDRAKWARMEDGTCNDLQSPAMGASGIAFGRNIPLDKITYEEENNTLFEPDPRLISRELMARKEFKPVGFLNFLVTSWLQFMNHDWFFHGENERLNPFVLDLKKDDDFHGQRNMVILRSKSDSPSHDKKVKKTFINTNTHWWDGSQVYGSNIKTLDKLRSFRDGLVRIGFEGNPKVLPIDSKDKIEIAGFKENWWTGLSMLHTLFFLEHNSIARHLKKAYPSFSDQELFDKARLVNAAVMAKIHTAEWTPAILNNPKATIAMHSSWYGPFNPQTIAGRFKKFLPNKTDWGIFSHPYLGGVVGSDKELRGVPYTLTEEFVSAYRMHPLLPEDLSIKDYKSNKKIKTIGLAKTRKEKSPGIVKEYGMLNLFYSFGTSHPGAMTLNNYPNFLRNLDVPIMGKMDLAAVDILRDRERGVPRYNEFRREIAGLKPIKHFEDLFKDPTKKESAAMLEKLKRIYQNDVEKLDLLVGMLAEEIRPEGFGFGETAFHIFIAMAPRRLEADRFFTTDYTKEVYTKEGINWVNQASMKSVILRHYPELSDALSEVKDGNAFFPWKSK